MYCSGCFTEQFYVFTSNFSCIYYVVYTVCIGMLMCGMVELNFMETED